YLLVEPKVRLTIAGDLESAVDVQLQQLHDRLAAVTAKAKQAGKPVGDAEADLAKMQTEIDAASAAMVGQIDALLAIQPGPDGQAIENKINPVRRAVATSKVQLRQAAVDGRDVIKILKDLGF